MTQTFMFLLMITILVTSCGSYPKATQPGGIPNSFTSDADAYLNNLVESGTFSGAVLVARGDEILLNKGYGFADREQKIPNTPQTKFDMGSITKQFTAMAILILQAQGKLNVQDPICKYIPDCPAAWQAITLHHLLTHTSGIPNFDAESISLAPSLPVQTIARFKDKPLNFQPGQSWSYSNSGYILLGYIIEQVTGSSYEDFLQQNIFTPLEMHNTGYTHNQSDLAIGYKNRSATKADFIDMSIPYAAGALYSTVEDLYHWDQALYTEKLIPQALMHQMFSAQTSVPDADRVSYGYGWYIEQIAGHRVFLHGGGMKGFSSFIARFPDQKTTIILMSNQRNVQAKNIGTTLAEKLLQTQ